MTVSPSKACWLASVFLLCLQSLADVARQEAERRRAIDQQGIEAKVVDAVPPDHQGNIAISSGVSPSAPSRAPKEPASAKGKASVDAIRTAIRKLDRSIQQTQERLASRQARLQAERWANPKTVRASARSNTEGTQNKLKQEIEDLQQKLDQLQRERAETYDRGRKAGFLPGELTGKGIVP